MATMNISFTFDPRDILLLLYIAVIFVTAAVT